MADTLDRGRGGPPPPGGNGRPCPAPAHSAAPFWCPGDRVSDHLLRTVVVVGENPEVPGWVVVRVVGRTIARNDEGRPGPWFESIPARDLRPLGATTEEIL